MSTAWSSNCGYGEHVIINHGHPDGFVPPASAIAHGRATVIADGATTSTKTTGKDMATENTNERARLNPF